MLKKSISPQKIIDLLSPFLTEGRKKRIEEVLNKRTRYITVVLYDLYHEHNMSAVVRSCEAFGLQECHVIEIDNRFNPSHGVAIGAQQWIDINRYNSINECIITLKNKGYFILAADPPDKAERTIDKKAFDINEIQPAKGPIAIVLGKELDGLTDEIRSLCDGVVYIPMAGFTESLNVSVTAAICIHTLRRRLEKIPKKIWELSADDRKALMAKWYIRSIKHGEKILEDLLLRDKNKRDLNS